LAALVIAFHQRFPKAQPALQRFIDGSPERSFTLTKWSGSGTGMFWDRCGLNRVGSHRSRPKEAGVSIGTVGADCPRSSQDFIRLTGVDRRGNSSRLGRNTVRIYSSKISALMHGFARDFKIKSVPKRTPRFADVQGMN
jgi:hypothetical protein